jgi:hypothetical protein
VEEGEMISNLKSQVYPNCIKTDCLYFNDQFKKCSIEDNDPEDCFLYVTEEEYADSLTHAGVRR